MKCGFQKEVSASKSPTFFSRKPLVVIIPDNLTNYNFQRKVRMKLILTLLIFVSGPGYTQVLNTSFNIRSLPDNSWNLHLKKDNSYKYTHWSGFSTGIYTLDSGQYNIKDGLLTFKSQKLNSTNSFSDKQFFVERIKVKRHQYISSTNLTNRNRTLFNSKIIVLKYNRNDSIIIKSDKPSDNINQLTISSDSSLQSWIEKNVLPNYQYKVDELDSTYKSDLYSSKTLEVIAIHNSSDLFGIFYLSDGKVYFTNYQRKIKYQIAILNLLKSKGLLDRKVRRELKRKIELITEKRA